MKVTLCERAVRFAAVMAIGVGLAASANAQTILVDLGSNADYRSVSAPNPDVNGNYWNSVSSSIYNSNLLNVSGGTTSVAIGFDFDGGHDSYNGPAGDTSFGTPADNVPFTDIDAAALGNLGIKEAAFDYYVNPKFEIQNLDPSETYNLTFFGSHKYNANNTSQYTIYTDATFTTPVASKSLNVGVNDLHNRNTVAMINGVAPQLSNILYVGVSGVLNSLQISAVPEPSSIFLLVSAAACIFGARRRNKIVS